MPTATPMTQTDTDNWSVTITPPNWAQSLEFVLADGSDTWDNNGGADWIVHLAGSVPAFVMDGLLDASATPLATNGTLTLWSAFAGSELYVAVQDQSVPRTEDLFILLATDPSSMRSAPWTKAGSTVDLDYLMPTRSLRELWLAAAAYQTHSGGVPMRQAPAGDGDNSITAARGGIAITYRLLGRRIDGT